MKISGEATLRAPVDKVYAALNDPAVLVRTIPGCERLDRVGPDSYRMVVTAGVAAVKGTYAGEVALTDQDEPHGFVLKASGSGAPGTVSAEARVRLAPADGGAGTTVTYDADAVVGGMVGGVGQRLLTGVAKKTAGEFFAAVNDVLTGTTAAVEPAPAAVAGEPEGPAPTGVYLRPAAPARAFPGGELAVGVLLGAGAALAGVVLGAVLARGPRGRR